MTPALHGGYAELHVTTNYSFLRGASHVEELLLAAKARGLAAIGVADRDTLAGIARAHVHTCPHMQQRRMQPRPGRDGLRLDGLPARRLARRASP